MAAEAVSERRSTYGNANFKKIIPSKQAFTCLKLTIETLEEDVKFVQS